MNGTEWLKTLMTTLGYGTVGASLIYFLVRNILKPSFDNYLNFRLEKAKIEEQSRFNIAEMYEQAKINFDDKIHTTKLEMETVKLNKVLPLLEELNKNIVNHKIMYYTYVNWILNNGRLRKGYEDERVKIDGEVIELVNQVAIYLPREMRALLYSIRAVISVSWKEPNVLHNIIIQDNLDIKDVGARTVDLYNSYTECFYEMVGEYCKIKNNEQVYSDILQKYNLDEKGKLVANDLMSRFVKAYILHHEFTSTEEYMELADEIKNIKI